MLELLYKIKLVIFLIEELLKSEVEFKTISDESMDIEADNNENSNYIYQCFILQCLAELFYCFPHLRIEFF